MMYNSINAGRFGALALRRLVGRMGRVDEWDEWDEWTSGTSGTGGKVELNAHHLNECKFRMTMTPHCGTAQYNAACGTARHGTARHGAACHKENNEIPHLQIYESLKI